MKLEGLVGDLEDAVSGAMAANSRKQSAQKILKAFDSKLTDGLKSCLILLGIFL